MMLDPASSPLGQMLLDEITPVVMVLRTPLVEETCQKNELSFLQMLTPFCSFNNIDVPVRTASDQPYRIKKFKLRLFYASDVRQPNIEVAKERLKQVITDAGDKYFSDTNSNPPPIESTITSSPPDFVPSWFQFFNKELISSVSFSDHEAFDHPVACLLVVSSKDEEPISKFVDLFNTNQLPSLLNDGAMDPKILKLFILVHDNQDGSSESATKMLAEMRSTFGYNECRLLCINSSQSESEDHQDGPWASYNSAPLPGQHIGSLLSNDDLDELRDVVHDLSSKHIIPHMEQKIRVLNQQVSATRKGFRNQIKNLWWRKGKEDTPDPSANNMYTFSSIESQIRVLGDYAFMLRDYELALSNYRLLSTDYKLDKAWKRYAGVQEMMGLTYFMLDQSRKDAEYCMENAFSTYQRIGTSGQRSATRCGLWWVEMLKTRDQLKEAASVYFRISGEEPLHSAVMLEQASYCYFLAKPAMLRKYGFHLILSGDLYKKCDQTKHAIRTYQRALSVFRGTTWNHIRDHVHFHVGKWYALLGCFDVAMKFMLEVIACSHQSKATQELILKDFFQILQKTGESYEVSRLQLPAINISMLKVVSEDHRTYGSPEAVTVRESLWQSLEEDMIPSFSTAKSNWLDIQPKLLANRLKQSNICVAGEALKVHIGFKNPLQISVSISNVSLICEHSARSDDERDTDSTNSTSKQLSTEVGERESQATLFTLSEDEICLEGGETIVAQLTVTPRVEGMLKIVGVRWKLSGSIIGFYNFEPDLLKKKASKGRRKSKQSKDKILEFLVIKSQPRLEGFIHHLPKAVYAGDLQRLSLELRNPSEIPIKKVKIKVSHPRFLKIGNREVMDLDFPACLKKKTSAQDDEQANSITASETVILPEDTVIQGETSFLVPLWLRAAAPGTNSLYLAIYYEIEDKSTGMRYRTLRMHYNLEVLPSLDVSFSISPCPSKLQEFLVRMDIINRTRLESFKLHQVSCIGNDWEISLLQPIDTIFPLGFLMAGQALSCFLKLKSGTTTNSVEGEGMDVRLGDDSSETLFDTRSSPFVDFHHYEILHQKVANQERQTSVDFILISQMQGSQSSPTVLSNSCTILSHHACNCSISSASPVWWLMEGPHTIYHNFSTSFRELELKLVIHNSSDFTTSVHIETFDTTNIGPSVNSTSGNKVGWHDASTQNESKLPSDILGSGMGKSASQDGSISPFIWSGSSSTRVKLEPMSTTEVPLLACIFCPGTYDLSNYALHWSFESANDHVVSASSGTCVGHPFFLTALQHD